MKNSHVNVVLNEQVSNVVVSNGCKCSQMIWSQLSAHLHEHTLLCPTPLMPLLTKIRNPNHQFFSLQTWIPAESWGLEQLSVSSVIGKKLCSC